MKVISFTEIQIKQYIEEIRPPKEMRDQVDISYFFKSDIVQIFEIRPKWDDPKEKIEMPIARIRYIRNKNVWRIHWLDSNEEWLRYTPNYEVGTFLKVIEIIKKDEHGCFWG